jgi:hypothetical protein
MQSDAGRVSGHEKRHPKVPFCDLFSAKLKPDQ